MANIMIVDDSYVIRQKLRAVLTHYGHNVVDEATTGLQAYRKYIECLPDLVTMDINMPNFEGIEMDGIDTVKKIIGEFPDAKILMISAAGEKSKVLSAIQSGAKHYIVKPFEDDVFIDLVNKVLGSNKNINEYSVKKDSISDNNDSDSNSSFSINVGNDIFTIKINRSFNADSGQFFETAVQGLLFVRPLKIVADFGETEHLEDAAADVIFKNLSSIEKSHGKVLYFSKSLKFIQENENRKYNVQIRLYSDNSELHRGFF